MRIATGADPLPQANCYPSDSPAAEIPCYCRCSGKCLAAHKVREALRSLSLPYEDPQPLGDQGWIAL